MKRFNTLVFIVVYTLTFGVVLQSALAEPPSAAQLIDKAKFERASIVVRAKVVKFNGGSKYIWQELEVLEVYKNTSGAALESPLPVAHYSWKGSILEGTATFYLEPYNSKPPVLWKVLDADPAVGVTHYTKPASNAR